MYLKIQRKCCRIIPWFISTKLFLQETLVEPKKHGKEGFQNKEQFQNEY
jgi:hypothetical protein